MGKMHLVVTPYLTTVAYTFNQAAVEDGLSDHRIVADFNLASTSKKKQKQKQKQKGESTSDLRQMKNLRKILKFQEEYILLKHLSVLHRLSGIKLRRH